MLLKRTRIDVYVPEKRSKVYGRLKKAIEKEFDQEKRKDLIEAARDQIEELKKEADSAIIADIDDNPFVKLNLRDTFLAALNKLNLP